MPSATSMFHLLERSHSRLDIRIDHYKCNDLYKEQAPCKLKYIYKTAMNTFMHYFALRKEHVSVRWQQGKCQLL